MILIIGGTSGIGLETACHLKSLGRDVTVAGRHDPCSAGIDFRYIDVTKESVIRKFFSEIDGSVEGLVYSAGMTASKRSISAFDTAVLDQVMRTNTTGLLLCLKYAYENLVRTKGRIVVVNSIASRTSSKYSGIEYTMSKAALSGAVRQLALDLAPDNILINSVNPSMTATPMLIENVEESKLDSMCDAIPLGRIANPLEVAKAIAFLLLEENTYMTGCGIDLNGGQFLNG